MTREDLEHVIRAAAEIAADREIVVVGSQAILAQFPGAPPSLLVSPEADLYPRTRPERAIEIDGALGDGSQFHATFGYYARGVGPETATAPAGWQERLVGVRVPLRPGSGETAAGWCMEAHDLVVAKCVAGREKDRRFAEEAVGHRLVDPDELLRRVADLPLPLDDRRRVEATVRGVVRRAGSSPPE